MLSHPSLRPDNLVIVPGSKAWAVKVDAVVFADGGNVVDCLMLACRAALWDTKVPRTKQVAYRAPPRHDTQRDMDTDPDAGAAETGSLGTKSVSKATDFELTDYWDEGEMLSGREAWPVCVTLNVVGFRFCVRTVLLTCITSYQTCTFWMRRCKKKPPCHYGCM